MDLQILNKIIEGDKTAFQKLVAQYQGYVYNICFKITLNKEDAQEASQDTFFKIYRSIKSFNQQAKLSTWIYRIAYNTAISKVRQQKPRHSELNKHDVESNDTNHLNESDNKMLLNNALQLLPANERGLIVMYYLNELSVKEINEITGMTKSNIKTSLFRARKKLKETLSVTLKNEIGWTIS